MKRIPLSLYLVLLFTRGLNLVQISGFKKNKESTDVSISIIFVGDIALDGCVKYYVNRGYNQYNGTMEKVARIIREADIAVGNLESPFVSKTMLKDRANGLKRIFLDAEPCSAIALKFAGFDVMNLGNNHLNDYGEKPINFTRNILHDVGIQSFGFNFGPLNTPQQPLIMTKKGLKISFLGYCDTRGKYSNCCTTRKAFQAGPAIYSDRIAERDIRQLQHDGVDVIIVYMHWGKEYSTCVNRRQKHIAEYLHSLGVTVVVGAHPHVLQGHRMGHSKSGQRLTAYSIGNFLFPQHGTPMRIFRSNHLANITKEKVAEFEKLAVTVKDQTRLSRILQLQLNRNAVIGARYLPLEITFYPMNKTLQPTPSHGTHWINVCSTEDKECLEK